MANETNQNAQATHNPMMDLQSLVIKAKEEKEPEKELSPLDQAIQSKQSGIVVTNEELAEGQKELEPVKPNRMTEEREQEFQETVGDLENLSDKAKAVKVINRPTDGVEMAGLMDELENTTIDENGNAVVPEGSKYIRTRTEEDGEANSNKSLATEGRAVEEAGDENLTEEERKRKEIMERRSSIVKILIDKTGLGTNIEFDEEESKVIKETQEIHLVEVEDKDLKFVDVSRPEEHESFLDSIDKYQLSVSKTKMTFPGSGFIASMAGLSYGEFGDIALDTSDESDDFLNFDKMYKKMSVVYSKMLNPTCGKFTDFTDFLKKFAYLDLPLATYGLLISTQPEVDTIGLKCRKKECQKSFNHTYQTRNLIDFETANTKYLEKLEQLNTCAPEDYLTEAENSAVRKFRRYQLPDCKYLVDIGLASCFDYLYGILDVLKTLQEDETITEDDPRLMFCAMLQAVRAISIPTATGEYKRYTEPRQLVEIMSRHIPPHDVQVLYSLYGFFTSQYEIGFSLKEIKCPHCGTITRAIQLTPDELVFQIHQLTLNTPVMLSNFLDF